MPPRHKEEQVDDYIIRIYRRDKKDPRKAAGVVEVIGEEGRKGFLDSKSLWAILTTPWGESGRRGGTSGRGRKKSAMTLAQILNRMENGDG